MKVAIVYDRVNKIGGAERLLLALHEIYPDAPLYTSVYNHEGAPWAKEFSHIYTSFLQNFPLAKSHHEFYPWLMPLVFESFNFDNYDLVISVTSEAAKGIITKPKTLHLCYCLTPTRYLWQSYEDYFKNPFWRWLTIPLVTYLRRWDKIAGQRPDIMLAISQNIAKRIKKYYQREAEVIYPPVNLVDSSKYLVSSIKDEKNRENTKYQIPNTSYYLIVSRLVPYKRIDIAVAAFNKLGLPLKIVGSGTEENRLKEMAGRNVEFLGQNLTDGELLSYYQNCRALIFPGEEDFGLVSIEAQLCGKPVIAFKTGGVLESVIEGKTGKFFYPQTPEALAKCIKSFKVSKFKPEDCRKNAERFSREIFKEKFKQYINVVIASEAKQSLERS